jgi:hypothetical protein
MEVEATLSVEYGTTAPLHIDGVGVGSATRSRAVTAS